MHSYFKMVSAVIVGIVIVNFALLGAAYYKFGRGPSVDDGSILHQHLGGPMLEYPVGGFTSGLFAAAGPTLHSVLDNLHKAAVDDRIDGVLLTLSSTRAGFATLDEIRAGIARVREAGKPVWAWSDDFALRDLYLASACDSFFVHPVSYIYLGGVYSEQFYLTGTLEKLGVQPQINQIQRYKSAAEMVTRTGMSPEAREMATWLLSDLYPRILDQIANGFGIERDLLDRHLTRTLPTAAEVVEMGLASRVRHWDELRDALPRRGDGDEPILLSAAKYSQVAPSDVGIKGKKKVAVVHAQGIIAGTKSGRDPFLGVTMGHQSVNRDLRRALKDEDVVGVVFRVDSRGGSSLTSDRIGRMVEIVNREKPVVVSMVDVAASGGYTISFRARSLMANPNTITGSIGSITGKYVARDLYNRLGITKDGVGIGPRSDFYSDYRPWTKSEFRDMADEHWASYRAWIGRIAANREMTVAEIDSVARGRVWTGVQALNRGLVDELGTLDDAVQAVKEAAGLGDVDVALMHLPQPEGFLSQMLGMELSTAPDAVFSGWIDSRMETLGHLSGPLSLMEIPVP